MERGRRRTQPTLERLEGRRLLNAKAIGPDGQPINDKDLARHRLQRINGVPLADRQIRYTTPQGTKVFLTLYGVGSLAGTSHADGVLDLVYDNTNAATRIIATTVGGTGRAPLRSVRDADVAIGELSGMDGNLVGLVSLRSFDLIDRGRINLTGGVGRLVLGSVGRGTQIQLRESPPAFNGTAATSSGRTLQYTDSPNGGRELTTVGGRFVPGTNLVGTQPADKAGPPPAPPGLRLEIDRVAGDPRNLGTPGTTRLPDPTTLVDAALIDVQGNIQSFRARSARGLVLNDAGNLNLVQIQQAADSVIAGFPFGHVAITRRSNVVILSPTRTVDGRGDVTVDSTLQPVGPLALP
jgi:hypothetical protein